MRHLHKARKFGRSIFLDLRFLLPELKLKTEMKIAILRVSPETIVMKIDKVARLL